MEFSLSHMEDKQRLVVLQGSVDLREEVTGGREKPHGEEFSNTHALTNTGAAISQSV